MKPGLRVSLAPKKPLMVYDGNCRFCTLWIERWRQCTGEQVDYVQSQDPSISERFPELPAPIFDQAVQFIETDGNVYSGAEAVFRSLTYAPAAGRALRFYQRSPLFARLTEWLYHVVARYRPFFSILTRLGWGETVAAPSHFLVRSLFLRSVGIIYLIAFVSLWTQVDGLIGSGGIFPISQTIESVRHVAEENQLGAARFHAFPTLCWLNTSDGFLHFQCGMGVLLALLVIARIAPLPSLALLWMLYLSLSTVSLDFLSFQWDTLLLETGFLAIFFAPRQILPRYQKESPPSKAALWLLRWLLFRFMFESGIVKLLSGDPTWRDFSALTFHYETQPLPSWLGWYAHQLPLWHHKFSVGIMFVIELVFPFLIFFPRRPRMFAGAAFVLLQIAIALTGNYGFFNLLTCVLCIVLLDDFVLQRFRKVPSAPPAVVRRSASWPAAMLATLVVCFTLHQVISICLRRSTGPGPLVSLQQWLEPFRTFNRYGLFAVMTTTRHEIVIEGSNDGENWVPYEFKYKPGDLQRRPRFVAPHMPRLDWQMWFAALGTPTENVWFQRLCQRLLEGSPAVTNFFDRNPFPDTPPQFIRSTLYDYKFTTTEERHKTGDWWKRERIGIYSPPVRLPTPRVRR